MANNPDTCAHERLEPRRRVNAAGVEMIARQCLDCGSRRGDWIARHRIDKPDTLAMWDVELENAGIEQRMAAPNERAEMLRKAREQANLEWWKFYNSYLESPEWQQRRDLVLKRDNYLCQACLKARATQVHHTTYKHVGHEPLFELVSVCAPCHDAITEADRAKSGGGIPEAA